MANFRRRKGVNISRVVNKLVTTVLAMYVGGQFLVIMGHSMLGTCSPLYGGLSLIGWKVGVNTTADNYIALAKIGPTCAYNAQNGADAALMHTSSKYILYDVSDAGIMAVIGLIGLGLIVTEFIEIRM